MARFQPGQSGNPGGQRKGPNPLKAACREFTARAVEILKEIAEEGRNQDRLRAVEILIERGWGKAVPEIDLDTAEGMRSFGGDLGHELASDPKRLEHLIAGIRDGVKAAQTETP